MSSSRNKTLLGIIFLVCAALIVVVWYLPLEDMLRYGLMIAIGLSGLMICVALGRKPASEPRVTGYEDVETYVPEVEKPGALLNELPVETIEGIGDTYGKKLRDAGILTVQDLLEHEPEKIAKVCDVSQKIVDNWVAMARFAWLDGISEEDAEAIVLGTEIREIYDLATADPAKLLEEIKAAVERGDVRVPSGYDFTLEMVKKWIFAAKDIVSDVEM